MEDEPGSTKQEKDGKVFLGRDGKNSKERERNAKDGAATRRSSVESSTLRFSFSAFRTARNESSDEGSMYHWWPMCFARTLACREGSAM